MFQLAAMFGLLLCASPDGHETEFTYNRPDIALFIRSVMLAADRRLFVEPVIVNVVHPKPDCEVISFEPRPGLDDKAPPPPPWKVDITFLSNPKGDPKLMVFGAEALKNATKGGSADLGEAAVAACRHAFTGASPRLPMTIEVMSSKEGYTVFFARYCWPGSKLTVPFGGAFWVTLDKKYNFQDLVLGH